MKYGTLVPPVSIVHDYSRISRLMMNKDGRKPHLVIFITELADGSLPL